MLLCINLYAQPTDLFFIPETSLVSTLDTFTVRVNIANVVELHGYSITVKFPENLLECLDAEPGNFLGSGSFSFPTIRNDLGTVKFDQAILGTGSQSGSGNLFIIRFQAENTGADNLLFDKIDLRNAQNDTIPVCADSGYIQIGLTGIKEKFNSATKFSLDLSTFPNPFNSTLVVQYSLLKKQKVIISIYDLNGRKIKQLFSGTKSPGKHILMWDGTSSMGKFVASGIYLINVRGFKINKSTQITFIK